MKTLAKFPMALLLLAGMSFADLSDNETGAPTIKPLGFKCTETSGGEETFYFECSVQQFDTEAALAQASYDKSYTTWGDFVGELQTVLNQNLVSTNASAFNLYFESDIDLGGFTVADGDTACVNDDFAPLRFTMLSVTPHVDGQGHSVKNFCYVNDGNVSFFATTPSIVVKDLKFENAYLKSDYKTENHIYAPSLNAAVLVDSAYGSVEIANVTIENSTLSVVRDGNDRLSLGALVGYVYEYGSLKVVNSVVDVSIGIDAEDYSKVFAGNLVGNAIPSAAGGAGAQIVGNVTMGGIHAPDGTLGFVIGQFENVTASDIVQSNYLLGVGDVNVDEPVGSWTGSTSGIAYNYRNATFNAMDSLKASGEFDRAGSGAIVVMEPYEGQEPGVIAGYRKINRMNGVLEDSLMKSRLFTYVLNEAANGTVYWENDENGFPYVSDLRTAYKLRAYMYNVYSALSDKDREALKDFTVASCSVIEDEEGNPSEVCDYDLYGYSDVNGKLPDLARRMNALSVRTAMTMESLVYDVNALVLEYDMDLGLQIDKALHVVYEMADPAIASFESLVSMDAQMPFYLWSRPDSIYALSAKGALPAAYVNIDGTYSEMSLLRAYMNCEQEYQENCYENSYSIQGSGLQNFTVVMDNFRYDLDMRSDTLHLVYGTANLSYTPGVFVASDGGKGAAVVVSYGYEGGKLSVGDSVVLADADYDAYNDAGYVAKGAASVAMPSKFGVAVKPGYVLKKWKADFWMGLNADISEMERCYGQDIDERCGSAVAATSTVNYLEPSSEIGEKVFSLFERKENQGETPFLKWTLELAADELLDMDSVVHALAYNAPYMAYDITYLLHVTADVSAFVNVALDLNGKGGVFYGAESKVEDSLMVVEGEQVILPAWVYTSDSCVLGWALEASATDYDYRAMAYADEILEKARENRTLYAVWEDAETCVERARYGRVRLVTEHGTVNLAEHTDDSVYTHRFAEDGTMLLPFERGDAAWTLRALPDSGYALDSLVITPNGSIDGAPDDAERLVLVDGDTLPAYLRSATLIAYFSEKGRELDSLEDGAGSGAFRLVRHELTQSGNAVRLILETNKFDAGLGMNLRLRLQSRDVTVSDTLLADSTEKAPYVRSWARYPLLPGEYSVSLYDSTGGILFDTAFTVADRIEAEGDSWKMLSLSDVAQDSIRWDGDPLFYRWDESAYFGDFWKYQKYSGGKAETWQGYWYSSLEGRPLILRNDSAKSGDKLVWELDSGWTMVANPYGWSIKLEYHGSLEAWRWNANTAEYSEMYVVGPYEAAWVYSEKKKTVSFQATPQFDTLEMVVDVNADSVYENDLRSEKSRNVTRSLAKASSRENWTLQAVLSDSWGHRDSWNVLGVGEVSERRKPPTGMGDLVNLSIREGNRALAKSVKSPGAEEYRWTLEAAATSGRRVQLSLEGFAEVRKLGFRVYVTVDGTTTEMQPGRPLDISLAKACKQVDVLVTPTEKAIVASKVGNLRLERGSGALQVAFDVDASLQGARYRVELVGLDGRVHATYSGKSLNGRNTLALDVPKPGLYVLFVKVRGHQAARKVAIQ